MFTTLIALSPLAAPSSDLYKPHVAVVEQRANLDPNGQQIHASLTVQSRVPLAVEGVRIGFLLAASDAALKGVNVDTVYEEPAKPGSGLKAVPYDAAVNLPPRATVTANMSVPMDAPVTFEPKVFLTHVLGYHLSEADATTLLELATSSASVDQVAACEALALVGDANAKAAARRRWGKDEGGKRLRRDFIEALRQPAPPAPEGTDTFRRIYAARALGVLGGPEAYDALSALAQDPNFLGQFDAPLQVLQRARESGGGKRVPLAFAVPADAISFAAVVQAAMLDVGGDPGGGFFGLRHGIATGLMVLFAVGTAVAVVMLRRQRGQ